ncbi:MAG: hypothetical protein HRT67_06555 [Flavobacteriaceae bacterium]|nr:hypothetical protein [Flavobacteriaceae bacterium]
MKKIILMITLILCQLVNSQMRTLEVQFKDKTIVKASGKISGEFLKYKLPNSKKEKVHFSEILSVTIYFDEDKKTIYKYFPIKNTKKSKVFEEIIFGDVSLYMTTAKGYNNPGGAGMNRIEYIIQNYYVRRNEFNEVTHLGSNQIFTKDFRKVTSEYFKDCAILVEKINDKHFGKREIEEIVTFYNENCN